MKIVNTTIASLVAIRYLKPCHLHFCQVWQCEIFRIQFALTGDTAVLGCIFCKLNKECILFHSTIYTENPKLYLEEYYARLLEIYEEFEHKRQKKVVGGQRNGNHCSSNGVTMENGKM
jgi:hypothetical protein